MCYVAFTVVEDLEFMLQVLESANDELLLSSAKQNAGGSGRRPDCCRETA